MRKGNLTRAQIEAIYGPGLLDKLDRENCDFTDRLQTDGDRAVEFSASVQSGDDIITAYYYQDPDALNVEDLGNLHWEINGYEID